MTKGLTKKEAYRYGLAVADEIISYGEFSPGEIRDEDAFREAFYSIEENRRQYAGLLIEEIKTDAAWDAYEKGLAVGLDRFCRKQFKE